MRDKLSKIIQSAVGGCAKYWADVIADKLLAEGVIVPHCKLKDTVYYVCEALSEVCKGRVVGIKINPFTTPQMWYSIEYDSKLIGRQRCDGNHLFGTFVFFTREEAEKALAERSKNGTN